MGRHAANRPAPDAPGAGGARFPHADLVAPEPGSAAARAAAERARTAFDALVEPHRSALHAYVLRLTHGDEAVAESVVKETLHRVALDPARYPQRASAARPWLVLTARAVLHAADRSTLAGHDDRPWPGPADGHTPRAGAPAHGTTVVRAMEDLSAVHRDLLVELFYGGVSLEDAAAARGVPVETVKSQLYFAMRALRLVLDRHAAP
jgi:RNA polymerase sigma-70 factor, ECF subfamily